MKPSRRALLTALGTATMTGLTGCTTVFGPRGRFDESTSLDQIVLQADELPGYQLQEQFHDPFRAELTSLTRDFVATDPDAVSPTELSATASVYPSPRRAANAVEDLGRVDYGRSTRYELAGRSTLEWTAGTRVKLAATDSNVFLLIEAYNGDEEQIEQVTAYFQRMLEEIPPQSSPDSS